MNDERDRAGLYSPAPRPGRWRLGLLPDKHRFSILLPRRRFVQRSGSSLVWFLRLMADPVSFCGLHIKSRCGDVPGGAAPPRPVARSVAARPVCLSVSAIFQFLYYILQVCLSIIIVHSIICQWFCACILLLLMTQANTLITQRGFNIF